MTTPQIIERWGYPAMIYSVETDDGYILELHRIPHGKNNVTWPNGKQPVVFMQHGLLCASTDWTMNLPEQSAGEYGFRGNVFQINHKKLNGLKK
uniref:Abhydro_lipase domain-containing protein n=1 Tax=Caenorhabditis tropicalis TaxID=1561998 RepID=A0A1I7TAR0_9PELO